MLENINILAVKIINIKLLVELYININKFINSHDKNQIINLTIDKYG